MGLFLAENSGLGNILMSFRQATVKDVLTDVERPQMLGLDCVGTVLGQVGTQQ